MSILICEACGHELEGVVCGECHQTSPAAARFCCHCGQRLPEQTGPAELADDPYDLDHRILCPDETCIGIITEEGVCSECGRPYRVSPEE